VRHCLQDLVYNTLSSFWQTHFNIFAKGATGRLDLSLLLGAHMDKKALQGGVLIQKCVVVLLIVFALSNGLLYYRNICILKLQLRYTNR